ncbi:MAG: hypothetical protein K9M82_04925 [Deltaproteobacteria bacterium]|nr:hypothetical protein [Deltaproteobacteria bacterium]
MKGKRNSGLFCFLFCLCFIVPGCSGYGKITTQRGEAARVTIEQLITEIERYDVYFMEADRRCSSSLIFDPREDDRVLRSSQWREIGPEESLSDFLYRVERLWNAEVYLLLGPDGRHFGFLYAAGRNRIYSKAIDSRTLELYMKATPCSSGPGPSGP